MPAWEIVFYPPSNDKNSPGRYIKSLSNETDRAIIRRHLLTLTELDPWDWPGTKLIDKDLYQVTAGNHRVYFCIDGRKLVVSHICRKVGRKAKEQDLRRARTICEDYLRAKYG